MRHFRIHIRPEAVFAGLQLLPIALRPLRDEGDAHDRLDRLESVFPRQREADRRAELVEERLAIGARHHEGEIVLRFLDGHAFRIGPRIPDLPLSRRDLRILERLEAQIFGFRFRVGERDDFRQRKTRPRDRHRPGFHAAVAVEPFLDLHALDQIVDGDLLRRIAQTVDLHTPRPRLQRGRPVGNVLRHAEFVEIIVVRVDLFRRDGAVELEGLVALGRIEPRGRVFGGACERRQRQRPADRAGARQHGAAVHEQTFRRRLGLRNFPGLADIDQHGGLGAISSNLDLVARGLTNKSRARDQPPARKIA